MHSCSCDDFRYSCFLRGAFIFPSCSSFHRVGFFRAERSLLRRPYWCEGGFSDLFPIILSSLDDGWSPSPDYSFENPCPDSIHHGESLPHSSSSKEGPSFHYPRSYASCVFHSGEVPAREEDSINWVKVHELSRSELIGGDKPPSPFAPRAGVSFPLAS